MADNKVFKIEDIRPIRNGMTVSRSAKLGFKTGTTFFSLGAKTSISRERYDNMAIYIGALGDADFMLGNENTKKSEPSNSLIDNSNCSIDNGNINNIIKLTQNDILIVPGGTLCGVETETGCVYTEIITEKETHMNNIIKSGEVMKLRDLISYEEGSISNLDVVGNDTMKFVLMAFDEGTGLTPHRAPGNAIVFALEGKAVIGYEGKDYPISAGEQFRFDKNGLHSVTADGKFKMALLLVLE